MFRATGGINEVAGDTVIATNLAHGLWEVSLDAGIKCA